MTRPQHWTISTMGQIGKYLNGRAFKEADWKTSGRPIIRIQNLTGSGKAFNYFQGDVESRYLVQEGDLLFSWAATLGTYIWNGPEAVLNQHIFKVESKINPKFHRYLLEHSIQEMQSKTHGSGMVHITKSEFDKIEVPVPPIEEQQRIVEALDDHLSRLDKALAELHEAEHNIELLIESYRHDVVSGVYSQGIEGWRHARLGEIARWGSGGTPQSGNPKYYGGSIPWCVIGDLTESDVILTEKSITDEGLAASSAKIVQPGTVLLAMYGASIGRTGLAATPMATNQAIAFAVPNPDVDPHYLLLFLQSQKRKFVHAGKGGAQPNISQTIIKDWNITFPPVEEQRRLIQQVKEHQQSMAVLIEQNHRMKNQVLLLKKSLLNAAFTGELKV